MATKLAPGTYWASHYTAAQTILTSKSEAPAMQITFQVTHVKSGPDFIPLTKPVSRSLRLVLTGAAEPYTVKKLESLGFNRNFTDPEFTNAKDLQLTCARNGEYENWDLADWGGTENKVPSAEQIMSLDAMYANAIKSGPPEAPTVPSTPTSPGGGATTPASAGPPTSPAGPTDAPPPPGEKDDPPF